MSEEKNNNTRISTNGISYNTTIAAAVATAVGGFAPAYAQDTGGIDEITVTASKRGEMNIQDLAGSIQAFGTEAIRNQTCSAWKTT